MSNKYARIARKAASAEIRKMEAENSDVVKAFLGSVSNWPLKDRVSFAWKIARGKYKAWGKK